MSYRNLKITFTNTPANGITVSFYKPTGAIGAPTLVGTASIVNGVCTTSLLDESASYRCVLSGVGAPTGVYALYTVNDSGFHLVTTSGDTSTTTAPVSVTSAVTYSATTLFPVNIYFWHFATDTFIANNVTVTIKNLAGTTVDTKTTSNGFITTSALSIFTGYNLTFSGTGAPTGTHPISILDHATQNYTVSIASF